MKGRREKWIFSVGGYQWERGGHKERGNEGVMVDVFCIHIWKEKTVEIVLRKEEEEKENDGGGKTN
jgi:hypothetical protein